MALRPEFDPIKFREQARLYAIRKKLNEDNAEDFAQEAILRVLHYNHFQPLEWIYSAYMQKKFGHPREEQTTRNIKQPLYGEDLLDTIADPQDSTLNKLEASQEKESFFNLLEKCPSLGTVKKLKRTAALRSLEFQERVESLKPLDIDWIKI